MLLDTHVETLNNGKRLRIARLGSGPPLLLLHGYPENLQIWSRVAPLLARRFEVIAFDWPGMGFSEAWPGGATPMILADRIVQLLDEWQIAKASLLAMDMGGQPALSCAARSPQRIERLVVMNSLVFGDERTSWEIRLLRRFGFNRFALRHLSRIVFRRAETTFLPRGVCLDQALRQDFWSAFSQNQVRRYISKMCAGYRGTLPRLPELYTRISRPTLIAWGEHDKHFPLVQARRLHETIDGSQLRIVRGGTHWMALQRADELASIIDRWFAG